MGKGISYFSENYFHLLHQTVIVRIHWTFLFKSLQVTDVCIIQPTNVPTNISKNVFHLGMIMIRWFSHRSPPVVFTKKNLALLFGLIMGMIPVFRSKQGMGSEVSHICIILWELSLALIRTKYTISMDFIWKSLIKVLFKAFSICLRIQSKQTNARFGESKKNKQNPKDDWRRGTDYRFVSYINFYCLSSCECP